jgi:phytoene dehydrogenase-like protein
MTGKHDAIVIGSGHNGLTCACHLAKAGVKVLVLEQGKSIGGMTNTAEVTLPGFKSDPHAFGYQLASVSSAAHELDLQRYGFALLHPQIAAAINSRPPSPAQQMAALTATGARLDAYRFELQSFRS